MTIGQKLTALRKGRGMTQEELSEAIGVTRQTISKWELDVSAPDLDYLCKLCDLFGVTADSLIRPDREPLPTAPPEAGATAVTTMEPPVEPPHHEPPPVSPTPPPRQASSPTRPAGWFLLGLAGLLLVAFLVFGSTLLLVCTGIALLFALKLLLIRRYVLLVVLWTAWGVSTFLRTFTTGSFFAVLLGPFFVWDKGYFPLNWHFIFSLLWLAYTALCIGVTVRMLLRRKRRKAAK